MKTLIVLLTCVFFATVAHAYTFDGELDPKEFQSWVTEFLGVNPDGSGAFHFINRDRDAKIKEAFGIMVVTKQGVLLVQYAYIIDEVVYVFRINKDSHYEQICPELPEPKKEPPRTQVDTFNKTVHEV